MGLDGLLQPAPISDAPGGRPLTSMSARRPPRPIAPKSAFPARRSAQRRRSKGRSAREEIVRRLDRTIRAASRARSPALPARPGHGFLQRIRSEPSSVGMVSAAATLPD